MRGAIVAIHIEKAHQINAALRYVVIVNFMGSTALLVGNRGVFPRGVTALMKLLVVAARLLRHRQQCDETNDHDSDQRFAIDQFFHLIIH